MRRFVALLVFLSAVSACEESDDVLIEGNERGVCAAAEAWAEGPLAEWAESPTTNGSLLTGCLWAGELVGDQYSEELQENFELACFRPGISQCDNTIEMPDSVSWSEVICESICRRENGSPDIQCLELLDPDGNC